MIDEFYVMKIQVIEIVSTENDWCYMAYKECRKKLQVENDSYKCPVCGVSKPLVKYMIMVHTIDAEQNNNAEQNNTEEAKVAHFVFFGRQAKRSWERMHSSYQLTQQFCQVKKVEPLRDLATRVLPPVGTSSTPQ